MAMVMVMGVRVRVRMLIGHLGMLLVLCCYEYDSFFGLPSRVTAADSDLPRARELSQIPNGNGNRTEMKFIFSYSCTGD
jgi:hypothetical protein